MTSNQCAEARAELQFSIADMARTMGIHRQTWTKWERGEQRPPAVAIRLIAVYISLYRRGILSRIVADVNRAS